MEIPVKIRKIHADAVVPSYQTKGSSGMDLHAVDGVTIYAGSVELIKTGLEMEIPEGFEVQIRSRSGLALKKHVFVLNAPATIDSDYRGELGVILMNLGSEKFIVNKGDRIAQMVLCPVSKAEFQIAEELEDTARGDGGFGSTGV